jgi:ribosomal protein S18 acetylase RimI-like enzyme
MTDLPENLLANPVWYASSYQASALRCVQRRSLPLSLRRCTLRGRRYGERERTTIPSLATRARRVRLANRRKLLLCAGALLQKIWSVSRWCCAEVTSPAPIPGIVPLSIANAREMIAFTDLAFPGFFRSRTCEMGSYDGVRSGGELIAMGGERITLDGYPEMSGICTHPAHRGIGHAANLIWHLVRNHRRDGVVSWLHVSAENHHAIELYLRMGFTVARKVKLYRFYRTVEMPLVGRVPVACAHFRGQFEMGLQGRIKKSIQNGGSGTSFALRAGRILNSKEEEWPSG